MMCSITMWYSLLVWTLATLRVLTLQTHMSGTSLVNSGREISEQLFADLEELSRIADISYCVGSTGIQIPFQCLSRCHEFRKFELVTVSITIRSAVNNHEADGLCFRRGTQARSLGIAVVISPYLIYHLHRA